MDNQHRAIKGYRDFDKSEIDLINEVKEKAEEVGILVVKLSVLSSVDPRWVNIGKTDLQKGFMALVRSVAKPEFF